MPGIIMPGTFLLGSRYYQEYAPGVAEDRGENVEMGLEVETPSGTFTDCVKIVDTNPLDGVCAREDGDVKIYAPGVGLIVDEELELTDYGFNIYDLDEEEEEEEEDPGRKKKKPKKNVFYGIKTKKGYTRTGYGDNTTVEIFHYLKEWTDPDPYVPDIHWFDFRRS